MKVSSKNHAPRVSEFAVWTKILGPELGPVQGYSGVLLFALSDARSATTCHPPLRVVLTEQDVEKLYHSWLFTVTR